MKKDEVKYVELEINFKNAGVGIGVRNNRAKFLNCRNQALLVSVPESYRRCHNRSALDEICEASRQFTEF